MSDTRHQPRPTSSRATYVLGAVAIVVVALIVGGFVWNSHKSRGEVSERVLADNAALVIGQAGAPVTIDIFEDFSCPVCKQFEAKSGQALVDAVDRGKVRARYHLLTFLDSSSKSGDYSTRAATAALCVAQDDGEKPFGNFHSLLYARQPDEGGQDYTNDQLAQLAAEAGASPRAQDCVRTQAKSAHAKSFAEQSTKQLATALGGRAGTPSVLVAGVPIEGLLDGTQWLDKLIASASTSG